MAKAGLPALTAEGAKVHYHAHLDVFRNGEPVVVPASIGIDYDVSRISPMHTHFDTGVIHIESEEDSRFTLAQFLTEWGVRLTRDCVGDVCAPDPIAVYVNGTKFDGGITDLVIQADKEIALILGAPPATIPKGYTCVNPSDACPRTPSP
jgi:hypothetical protein